ncbi:MAG: DNA adenine methylase [Gammaproteobacteria bacterium]
MRQFFSLFPAEINNFYEPFVGGGTVFLNVAASKYFLNDVDKHLIAILRPRQAESEIWATLSALKIPTGF